MPRENRARLKVRPPAPDAIDAPWRLFLAVCLDPDVQRLVADEIAALTAEGWPVRWVQPETSHLTLHFLGETERERAELVRLALPDVVAAHAPFDLRTAALGVFPNFRRPRVLWLGLHGPVHRLQTLHQDIGRALQGLGFPSATSRITRTSPWAGSATTMASASACATCRTLSRIASSIAIAVRRWPRPPCRFPCAKSC